jgi:hypothetical protein
MLRDVLANLFSRDLTANEQAHVDQYTATLVNHLETAALAAIANRSPALLSWGKGTLNFAQNRRTPGGPVDHDMPLLCVRSPEGTLRALFVSYACHCTTLGPEVNQHHGDWAGEAQERIEQSCPGAIAMVAIGCGGDANPQPRTGLNFAQQHGEAVAAEVNRLLSGALLPLTVPPRGAMLQFVLPYEPLPSRAEWESRAAQGGIVGYHAAKNLARLDRGEALPTTLPYRVQTWRFDDELAMVFLAGEVVVDYSLRLKTIFDRERLWVNAYANDVPCYIPSARLLNEGGYEADTSMLYYDRPTRLDLVVEDLIVQAVFDQVPASFLPMPDTNAPILLSAATMNGVVVGARFDRPLDRSSAEATSSYQFDPTAGLTNALLQRDDKTVALSLQNEVTGPFTVAATAVKGLGSNSTLSQVTGVRLPFTAQDIGSPLEASAVLPIGNGDLNVRAAGQDIWEKTDVFNFIHQERTGDFDVRVQVASFEGIAENAKAALMVRENLASGSRHFTLTVYPSQGNWTAFWRLAYRGTSSVAEGDWRVPWPGNSYPNVWMRLKRAGNTFTLYGGSNGHDWIQVGDSFAPSPVYPSTVYVGLATTSMSEMHEVPPVNIEYRNFGDIGMSARPQLRLVRANGQLLFSWPASASTCRLQQRPALAAGSWLSVTNLPLFFNGECRLALPQPGANAAFYRLAGTTETSP